MQRTTGGPLPLLSTGRPPTGGTDEQQQREDDRSGHQQSRYRRQLCGDGELVGCLTQVARAVLSGPAATSTVTVPEAVGVTVTM